MLVVLCLVISAYVLETYVGEKFGATARLSWKELKNFYRVEPRRWKYGSPRYSFNPIRFLLYNASEDNSWDVIYRCSGDEYVEKNNIMRVRLSFLGWLAFHFTRLSKGANTDAGTAMICKSVAKDIEKIRRKNEEEMNALLEQLKAKNGPEL